MNSTKIKIGVLGVGHLGNIHLKCLQETLFDVAGCYDPDAVKTQKVAEEFNITAFHSAEALVQAVDAVDIVTSTSEHYRMAKMAILKGKHVFIEKPVTSSKSEARQLMTLIDEAGVIGQVGHVERFNPAFLSIQNRKIKPRFIEVHRLAMFNPRGTDVSVVLDLMIHDLDLLLSLVKEEVVDIQANGVSVVNLTSDICNARITFANGCVANVTASRISLKNMRKIRIFQEDSYVSVDFLSKESQVVSLKDVNPLEYQDYPMTIETKGRRKAILLESPKVEENNAIVQELREFHSSISTNKQPLVSIEDGYKALLLADQIETKISESLEKYKTQ